MEEIAGLNRSPVPRGSTSLKLRLVAAIRELGHGLLERDTAVRLAVLALLAGEHLLLIGPPGTAKSELARRLHRLLADGDYFERLLTRFSVPEELFGPLSIMALEDDRYERRVAGYLPAASVAFVDEVFKANSAILNSLLTLLNEREFDNGTTRLVCPLISLIGASNELPDDESAAAFLDRFLLRHVLAPVSREAFGALLEGVDTPVDLPVELRLTISEIHHLLSASAAVSLAPAMRELLVALRDFVVDRQIYVSDRRWRKIVRVLKVAAFADGRSEVAVWDGFLLPYCIGARSEQEVEIFSWLARRLGVFSVLDPERFRRVIEGFEAQLELEQNATELNYNADGRLSMFDGLVDGKKGEGAARMPTHARRRAYGEIHVAARVTQVEGLVGEVDEYLSRLSLQWQELHGVATHSLWIAPALVGQLGQSLGETEKLVVGLRERLLQVRDGFYDLPRRHAEDDADFPAPMSAD